MQTILREKLTPISSIGSEIGFELGQDMVLALQKQNPGHTFSYEIGRDIIDRILSQPGCAGIKLFEAANEAGEKTLVYVGLDSARKSILEITEIDSNGSLHTKKGIVADRIKPVIIKEKGLADSDDWGWTID